MACQIVFELPNGKELKIQTDLEEEDFLHPESFNYTESELKLIDSLDDSIKQYIPEDLLDLVAHALINYSGSDKNLILSQLSEVELTNDTVSFGDSGILVSNISGDRLKSRFPDVTFSETIPPVLLISGQGDIIKQGDVYVVPLSKIKLFAEFTKQLDALKLYKSGVIESDKPNEIFQQVQQTLNNNKVALNLDKVEKDIQDAIEKALSSREHKKDEDGDNLISLRLKLDKWNEELNKLNIDIYRTKEGSQNNQQIKDKIEALEKKIRFATQKVLDIEEDLRKIENLEIIPNKKLQELINRRNVLTEQKDILCRYINTFDLFIEHYIHNKTLWDKSLNDLTKESITSFIEEITDNKKAYKIGNSFIDSISKILFKEQLSKQKGYRISINDVIKLLKQKGFDTNELSTSQIYNLLINEYSDKQELFKIKELKSESQLYFYFTKLKSTNLFTGPLTIEQRQLFVADYILDNSYKGYYITKINNYFIISDRPVNQYSQGHKYATREEAIQAIELGLENKKIVSAGKNYLSKAENFNEVTEIELPSSKIKYRRGEILSTLNIKAGFLKPHTDTEYYDVLKIINTLKTSQDPVLKELGYRLSLALNSPLKAGIALSHFLLLDPITNYSYYTLDNINFINSILDKIENAQPEYFVVTSDSIVKNGKNFVSVIKVDRETLTKPQEVDYIMYHTPNVLLLESMALTLSKYGLNIEIVTNDQMRDISGTDLNKGFLKDGIIYLNRDTATALDLLHEHTHILLGLLKNENPQAFKKILLELKSKYPNKDEFNQIFNEKMTIYANDVALISDLQERELFILEEIFADSFADYLLGKNDLNDIFNKVEKGLNSHPLFEGKNYDLHDKTLNDLFRGLLSEVKSAYQNIGFGFPTSKKVYNQLDSAIKKNTKDADIFDENKHLIKRDCK